MSRPPVTLVRGDDTVLVRDAARNLVESLVGDGDRGLMLTELAGDDYELRSLVDAAQTPPFLTDRRIVVGRDLQRFKAAELAPLLGYLADPLDTTDLVLVWGDGRVPKGLADAVAACGGTVLQTGPGSGKAGRKEWFDAQLAKAGIGLDSAARRLLDSQLGDDLARLPAILTTLVAVYGGDARLGADDVAPYLGAAGSVPPWELTDAIDRGDVALAVERLTRMLESGDRHPLQVMVTLTNHFERMLALSGSSARSERDAAALLGMKGSTFPARKALDGSRRLGPERLARAVNLLADADLDLRGDTAWSAGLVMEVLVARLAQLNR
jgi:DNA polymerase-3 subunit delta